MVDVAELAVGADTSGLKQGERDLDRFAKKGEQTERRVDKSTGSMSQGFSALGRAATVAAAAIGAAFSAGQVVQTLARFEQSMSRVRAITRATGQEFEDMRRLAVLMGSSTEFSASQAAEGLTFLGMAGFEASESMAALPAVLDLATASGDALGQTADTVSNIMSAFGIAAANSARVTDVLAAASTRSNTSVSQLGQAISTVGPVAAAMRIEIEDTAAAIGVLGDAGIQGERAGTGLRGVLASLAGPTTQAREVLASYGLTVRDVDPQVQGLSGALQNLGEVNLSTADAMVLFGREASAAGLTLIGSARRVGKFGDEIRDAEGAAGDMARTMRDNLQGDINGLLSAVEGLIIALGDAGLSGAFRGAVQDATGLVRAFSSVAESIAGIREEIDLLPDEARLSKIFQLSRFFLNASVLLPGEATRRRLEAAGLAIDNRGFNLGEVGFDATSGEVAGIGVGLPGSRSRRLSRTGSLGDDVFMGFAGADLGLPPFPETTLPGGGSGGGSGGTSDIQAARDALRSMRDEASSALVVAEGLQTALAEGWSVRELNISIERTERAQELLSQITQAQKDLADLPAPEREKAIQDLTDQWRETMRLTAENERGLEITRQLAQAEREMGSIAQINRAIRNGASSEDIASLRRRLDLQERLNELRDEGYSDDKIARLGETLNNQRLMIEENDRLNDSLQNQERVAKQVDQAFETAFASFVTGTASAQDALAGLLNSLAQVAASQAFQALLGGGSGGGGGIFGTLAGSLVSGIGGLFGGGGAAASGGGLSFGAGGLGFASSLVPRANGGPVFAGRPYEVGEHGREMFIPNTNGQIIPNGASQDPVRIVVVVQPSGEFDARVENTSRRAAVQVVDQRTPGMINGAFDRAKEERRFS